MLNKIKESIKDLFENNYDIEIIKENLETDNYCLNDFIIDENILYLEFLVDNNNIITYERFSYSLEV